MGQVSIEELSDDDRKLLRAIREITRAVAATLAGIQPRLVAKYGLGVERTNLAIAAALAMNTTFASKMALGESLADCADLDQRIFEAIRQTITKEGI